MEKFIVWLLLTLLAAASLWIAFPQLDFFRIPFAIWGARLTFALIFKNFEYILKGEADGIPRNI